LAVQEGFQLAQNQGVTWAPSRAEVQSSVTAASEWTYEVYGEQLENSVVRPAIQQVQVQAEALPGQIQQGAEWIKKSIGQE
jgi:hypothetical protein